MVTSSLLTEDEIKYLNESQPAPIQNYDVTVKSTEFDINYDTGLLTYDRAQFNNATVTEPEKGHLHIVTSKAPSSEDIKKYSETRITQLVFRTADVSETTAANLALSNGAAYGADGNVLENVKQHKRDW